MTSTNDNLSGAPVFTSIECVVRTTKPALLALLHVVQLLDELLDVSARISLPQAAASGSVRLFDRVYYQQSRPPMDPYLLEHNISNAMGTAVRHSHFAIVQRIHLLHPQKLPVLLLPIATKNDDLALFQWLLTHRMDDLCTPQPARGPPFQWDSVLACCLSHSFETGVHKKKFAVVKWLLENGYDASKSVPFRPGNAASAAGDLEMVQFLHIHENPEFNKDSFRTNAIADAARGGHLEIVQFLLANRSDGFTSAAVHYALFGGYGEIHDLLKSSGVLPAQEFHELGHDWAPEAAQAGRLDLLQSDRYVVDHAHAPFLLLRAGAAGHLGVAQWLCERYQISCDRVAVEHTAGSGQVRILEWIHDNGLGEWSPDAMDAAARRGHLATVQWLHRHRQEGCTARAMDDAASKGHLEIVQWLHENRTEGCTTNAMDSAAARGCLDIVQWLHLNRTEGCSTRAMDAAAGGNHLHVVQWLHVNRFEGATTEAMDSAARNGHLEMVMWLHTHRHEGCTTAAMDYGTPIVLKWLHVNRHEGCTTEAMDRAAERGDLQVLEFLCENRAEAQLSQYGMDTAVDSGHLFIVKWLYKQFPNVFDANSVYMAALRRDQHHIIRWLEDEGLDAAGRPHA